MNISISKDDLNSNEYLTIFEKFKSNPKRISIHGFFDGPKFIDFLDSRSRNTYSYFTEIIPIHSEIPEINERFISEISDEVIVSFLKMDSMSNEYNISNVKIYYKSKTEIIDILLSEIQSFIKDETEEKVKINRSYLPSLIDMNVNLTEIEFDKFKINGYYTSSNSLEIKNLIEKINNEDRGISILRGERGLGKTTASKIISSKFIGNSVFIPSNMIDHTILSPIFRNTISDLGKSLFIIDDCEFNFLSNVKFNYLTNMILNYIDGPIDYNIHFILIFNSTSTDDILYQSNNFLSEIKFDKLSEEESNKLSKKLKLGRKFKTDSRLIDVLKSTYHRKQEIGI